MIRLTGLLLMLAPTAMAQSPLTAEGFESHVTGQTLEYSSNGEVFGVEEYFPNRRVRWSFLDGECQEGIWYEDSGQICFVYEDIPDHQCWRFYLDDGRLSASFTSDPTDTTVYGLRHRRGPLQCLGPEVGV